MAAKVYKGTVDSLLENDAFVSEFLLGVKKMDFSRLIDEGIFSKFYIADSCRNRR